MQGIKVNLDNATVSLVRQQFTQLITDLESKAQVKINVNFGNSVSVAEGQMNGLKTQMNDIMGSSNLSSGFKMQMDKSVITAKEDIAKIKGSFSEIEAQYKKLGNYKITPTKFDANGEMKAFTVQLEQVEGLIDKINYKSKMVGANSKTSTAMSPNGDFTASSITETDKTGAVAIRNLKEQQALANTMANARESSNASQIASEQKLGETQAKYANQAINANAKEKESNDATIVSEDNKLKVIQLQYAEKIKLLRANSSAPTTTSSINSLQSNVNGLATTGNVGVEKLKLEYNEILRIQTQLNAEKLIEQRLTAQSINSQMRLREVEAQRVTSMGTSQGSLGSGFFAQSNKEIMQYGKSLLSTDATIKSFQRTTDSAGNSIIKMTSATRGSNGATQQTTQTFDANTNSVYRNAGAIKTGASSLGNMLSNTKKMITSMVSMTLVMVPLFGALAKLKEGFTFINDLNKSETNIKMITGLDDSAVTKMTNDYSALASTLHETTSSINYCRLI